MIAVTISWPNDPDRSIETYGPFATTADQSAWVDALEDTRDMGRNPLLDGAHFTLHTVVAPFDPWDASSDVARWVPTQ